MKRDCLNAGDIQAFLDGELAPAATARVSAHIAACDTCAVALAEAEEESAFVFAALDREMNTLVPTQRLWARINESIEHEKHTASFWHKTWTFLSPFLTGPSFATAAAAVIVLGLGMIALIDRGQLPTTDSEIVSSPQKAFPAAPEQTDSRVPQRHETPEYEVAAVSRGATLSRSSAYARPSRSKAPGPVRSRSASDARSPQPSTISGDIATAAFLPGEESYVKTIATLSKSVENSKDSLLRPSEQVSYARDLAVVNDSIERMRREVRRNPRNESAKHVLYSSYQNKIDLLNSVAQREELVVSIR